MDDIHMHLNRQKTLSELFRFTMLGYKCRRTCY